MTGRQQQADVLKTVVICVEVATGSERVIPLPLPLPNDAMQDGLDWLDDGSLALIASANAGAPTQVWRLSYPDGRLSRLTNDVNNYRGISLTVARDALVTAHSDTRATVWVGDGEARTGSDMVPLAPVEDASRASLAWAADRLLFNTTASGWASIARILPGHATPEEVVVSARNPAATSDGRTIVFESTEQGARAGLWKVDAEGRHAVQLVSGIALINSPLVTADDRQVVFISNRSGLQSPWIVPIDGGTPVQIVNVFAGNPGYDLSPDGKSLVFPSRDEQNRLTVIVCDLPACANRRNVTLSPNNPGIGHKRWTSDGRSIAYIDVTQANIWVQPLDGKAPRQLTHFTDGRTIGDFAWSRDGKRLAVSRVSISNDIVLFKGLKR